MTKRILPVAIVAVLIVAGVAISLSVGEDSVGKDDVEQLSFEQPVLTESEISFAEEALANDSRAQALLGNTPYEVTQAGVILDADLNKTGVVLRILMSEPISVEGEWPQRGQDEPLVLASCNAPDGVTDILAGIDATSGELISLDVGPGQGGELVSFHFDCEAR